MTRGWWAGGVCVARDCGRALHLCVDLGEGLRELGLEAADLRLHRVEDVSFTWRGGWGWESGCEWGVNRWRWRFEVSSFTSSLWLVSSRRPSGRSSGRRGRPRTLRTCRSREIWSSGAARRGGGAAKGRMEGVRERGGGRGGGAAERRVGAASPAYSCGRASSWAPLGVVECEARRSTAGSLPLEPGSVRREFARSRAAWVRALSASMSVGLRCAEPSEVSTSKGMRPPSAWRCSRAPRGGGGAPTAGQPESDARFMRGRTPSTTFCSHISRYWSSGGA